MLQLADGLRVVDADSHMTERHDLFTERAPKGYEDKVPHVERIDGMDMWVIEGKTFGKAGSGGTVDHDGKKHPFQDSQGGSWGIDDVHPAAWDPKERLRLHRPARHRRPGALPELHRPRRPEPVERHHGSQDPACSASSSTTTPWPRCRRSRGTGSCPCRSCRRGTSPPASVRPSAAPTWATGAST